MRADWLEPIMFPDTETSNLGRLLRVSMAMRSRKESALSPRSIGRGLSTLESNMNREVAGLEHGAIHVVEIVVCLS